MTETNEMALYGRDLFGDAIEPPARGKIAESFLVPPFSVLNAREGFWQDRKRAWLSLGIKSEVGRDIDPTCVGKNAPDYMANRGNNEGGSIFDPVLCELAYRWWAPPGGLVLDPFSGGSVRGIVASQLGRRYRGIELRAEQIAANREQAAELCGGCPMPEYIHGDALHIRSLCSEPADFVFSCPPYGSLEVYSDNPADLSTMDEESFLMTYNAIIAATCSFLKPDRFACFVVGDYRDSKGNYCNFVSNTIKAFEIAGLHLYNEAVLVTAVGSLPVRIGKQFTSGRKLGKTHQNVLVFVKGDGKRATSALGAV